VALTSLAGDTRPISEWTTTFPLVLVAIDPFTYESAWILPTAGRLLRHYADAGCRTAFLATCRDFEARQFLGPWVDELMVFVDPQRSAVTGLGVEALPAFCHVDQANAVVAKAEGWDPAEWRKVAIDVSRVTGWGRPSIPEADDPAPFPGTPIES
jgi:hypothetical protein